VRYVDEHETPFMYFVPIVCFSCEVVVHAPAVRYVDEHTVRLTHEVFVCRCRSHCLHMHASHLSLAGPSHVYA
jgi:hypothetical protein